uniref:POTRA domain-containing protein n=1 Tax=Tanacetum cinerariifolium TaxID=118510 RepID=A0A699GG07_TANCI|nr:hypothetical protein [Tanacetum cinerariifolium]
MALTITLPDILPPATANDRPSDRPMTLRFPRLLAGSLVVLACHAAGAQDLADDSGNPRFDIARFDVRGNTLLPAAQVAELLAAYAGKDRDFGDVQRALEALEAAFQARGYKLVTVQLPEQELNGGVVVLRVVETRIGRVSVRNNRYFDEANVRRALPTLAPGRTPDVDAMSANLRQANENPSRELALTLQAGDADDAVDAVLDVKDSSPWRATVNLDNTGNEQTGKTHMGVMLQHANLFGRDHLASLQYVTSAEEPGRVKVYGAGYHVPFYDTGDALDVYASYSNVDSGTVSAGAFDLAVSGKGAVYGARYSQALRTRGAYQSALSYGVDVKDFRNSVVLLETELGNDVMVHPVSIGYQGTLPLAAGQLGAQVTLVRNIPGGKRGAQDDFTLARSDARDDYTLLRFGASLTQAVGGDWQVRAIANGQFTRDALIPGEQFGAGGATSVRGFVEREVSNDSGLAVNLETYTPNLCANAGWNCRLLGFYDAAHVHRNHALAGELESTTIASAGVGARVVLSTWANLQLDYGHVLRAGATTRDNANRLHLRLALAY